MSSAAETTPDLPQAGRCGVFSDLQGNLQAWEAILADMKRLHVDVPVCLGNLVGDASSSRETFASVRAQVAHVVRGENEAAMADKLIASHQDAEPQQLPEWGKLQLDRDDREFLAGLPGEIGFGDLLFTHHSTAAPRCSGPVDGIDLARAHFANPHHRLTFVGQSEHPAVFERASSGQVVALDVHNFQLAPERSYLVMVGSAGRPAHPENPRSCYVIFDRATQGLFFRSVAYDPQLLRTARLRVPPTQSRRRPPPPPPLETASENAGHRHDTGAPEHRSPPQPPVTAPARKVADHPPGHRSPPPPPSQPAPPGSAPDRHRRGRGRIVALALTGVLMLLGGGAYLMRDRLAESARPFLARNTPQARPASPNAETSPHHDPAPPDEPPRNAVDEPPAPPPTVEPAPESTPAPPPVADLPDPAPPETPAPTEPDPAPSPTEPAAVAVDPGPPPIPLAPPNASTLPPPSQGLLFYVPFDEPETELTARDLVGDRDLDIAGGLPGALGQVGTACRLESQNGSEALVSPAQPLPPLTALTIALWVRHADPPAEDLLAENSPDTKTNPNLVASHPATTLLSLGGLASIRLENHDVIADLAPQGESARLSFPRDRRWHHVLVESRNGQTTMWIDHRSQSQPVPEPLAPPPPDGAAVTIGGTGAHLHVDEAAIWGRVFSPEERQVLYRNGRLDIPILAPLKILAHWGFDDEARSRVFHDATGRHPLGAYKSWQPASAIAPDPIPLTRRPNPGAARVWHLAENPEEAGTFCLTGTSAFTYEGWVKCGPGSEVTLASTLPPEATDGAVGWRLDARPTSGATGVLRFLYQSGSESVEALSNPLPLYDSSPHHFAAVWNPAQSITHGSLVLFVDNEPVASASLPLSSLSSAPQAPFHFASRRAPVIVDEIRFSSGALKPEQFLTAGRLALPGSSAGDPEPAAPEGETPMQRRAREAAERRAKQRAEMEERRREEEAKRRREPLSLD